MKAESLVENRLFPFFPILFEESTEVEQSASTYPDLFFSSVFAACLQG